MCIFFLNDTATTEIYTLSLHDALPICVGSARRFSPTADTMAISGSHSTSAKLRRLSTIASSRRVSSTVTETDRKSTRLNSSHDQISYAVFCLKKKKHHRHHRHRCAHAM